MYKDPILQQYTEKKSKEVTIPESVVSTLVRGTISNMVTGCQGVPGRDYPHSHEIIAVAKHLTDIYPCLERIKPNGKPTKGVFLAKLQKRLRNVKLVKNPQGKIPQRSKLYKKENGQLDSDKIDERKNQQHQQQQQNHKTTNLRTQVPAQKSLNFEDNDEELFQHVQNIVQITQTDSDALDRYSVYLDRELESSKPDDETLTRYCDLLFESRRETILGVNYERWMSLIKSNHKVLVQQPMQLIIEVGRIFHQETKMFTQEVIKRLSVLTDSLLPYVYTKFNTNKSLIETLHNPNFNISWTKLVSILSVIDVLFDGKKKKKSIVQLIHDEDDPNIKRKLLLPELPGLAEQSPSAGKTPPKRNLALQFHSPIRSSVDMTGYVAHVGEIITASESGNRSNKEDVLWFKATYHSAVQSSDVNIDFPVPDMTVHSTTVPSNVKSYDYPDIDSVNLRKVHLYVYTDNPESLEEEILVLENIRIKYNSKELELTEITKLNQKSAEPCLMSEKMELVQHSPSDENNND
ncbi:uncharacterized protein [Clytia hemisphaerica]